MTLVIDSTYEIALARINKFLIKYSYNVFKENGIGQNLLECVGLSELAEKYKFELQPYKWNGDYKNKNPKFIPAHTIPKICSEIKENKQVFGKFLDEFFSRITEIESEDIENIQNNLELIGYQLLIEIDDEFSSFPEYKYTLISSINGVLERQKELSYIDIELKRNFSDLVIHYEEAISNYGNSEYISCISSCRLLFEKFFKAMDPEIDVNKKEYLKGILATTKETVTGSNTPKLSQRGIFEYWIKYKKGFNRYRAFVSMYSLMSGLGSHGEKTPSKEDALFCLRVTEDILIWYFRENEN